jgi:hypothetical protein
VLEATVLKGDKKETIFDEMDQKLQSMDVMIKVEIERLTHAFDLRFKEIEEKVFTATNKISENTMLKA